MYVITFYSFKGGVGRTMALVNVAAELVRRGRKVLVVDFDLEAPGVTTYKYLRPLKPSPGVVEYVTEFIRTNESPDVSRFVYPVDLTPVLSRLRRRKSRKQVADADSRESTGQLWVMPAGKGDAAYGAALAGINWNSLYENQHGYLFFEDTKLQWEESIKPDYVLIDSRTGHTDVGGICTRQLADAVVLMFAPNKQNLVGLQDVCNAIRAEKKEDGRSSTIHLVMSNVPRLDDEEDILRRQERRFLSALGFPTLDGVIDRYDSLKLLDQRLFVLERPRARLARQYRRLVWQLIIRNLEDREGARAQLRRYRDEPGVLEQDFHSSPENSILDMLRRATDAHPDDQQVLVLAAGILTRMSNFEAANDLLDRAIWLKSGDNAQALLLRSQVRFELDRKELAVEDLIAAINLPTSPEWLVVKAIWDLYRYDPHRLQRDIARERLDALSPSAKKQVTILLKAKAADSSTSYPMNVSMGVAYDMMLESDEQTLEQTLELHQLSSDLLYQRQWTEVIDVLRGRTKFFIRRYQALALINEALAHWGLHGEMPEHLCRQIVAVTHAPSACEKHAADCQALALVNWRLGEPERAKEYVQKALRLMDQRERPEPSYWRCLEASPEAFRDDCRLIDRLIDGERLQPLFLAGTPAR